MKELEPRRSYEIDQKQMQRDFETIPVRKESNMKRARLLVEDHIGTYGMVPHPDKLKEAIAAELDLVQLYAVRAATNKF